MSQDFGNGYTSANSIAIIWHIDDVKDQLEALNEGEGINVERYHDANYGVTWEHLYQGIEYCFQDEIEEAKAQNNLKEQE